MALVIKYKVLIGGSLGTGVVCCGAYSLSGFSLSKDEVPAENDGLQNSLDVEDNPQAPEEPVQEVQNDAPKTHSWRKRVGTGSE